MKEKIDNVTKWHSPDDDIGKTSGIYIIRNKTTGGRYVGQARDIQGRIDSHFNNHGRRHTGKMQVIDQAIDDDRENFEWAVLEECSPEGLTPEGFQFRLSELEAKWMADLEIDIKGVDYNQTLNTAPHTDMNVDAIDSEIADNIKRMLKIQSYTIEDIIKNVAIGGVTINKSIISNINTGRTFTDPRETYPIRLSRTISKELREKNADLLYEKYAKPVIDYAKSNPGITKTELARRFNTGVNQVSNILEGKTFKNEENNMERENETIIVSKHNGKSERDWERINAENHIDEIYEDLREGSSTLTELAQKYGCGLSKISRINRGEIFANPYEVYPINEDYCNELKIDKDNIYEIHEMLRDGIPQSHIAKTFNVSVATVSSINSGKRNKVDGVEYPIHDYAGGHKKNKSMDI